MFEILEGRFFLSFLSFNKINKKYVHVIFVPSLFRRRRSSSSF